MLMVLGISNQTPVRISQSQLLPPFDHLPSSSSSQHPSPKECNDLVTIFTSRNMKSGLLVSHLCIHRAGLRPYAALKSLRFPAFAAMCSAMSPCRAFWETGLSSFLVSTLGFAPSSRSLRVPMKLLFSTATWSAVRFIVSLLALKIALS